MKVLIIGATAALAHETAKHFARDGAELFLVGRDEEKLQAIASDLKVRGAKRSDTYSLDLSQLDEHQHMFEQARQTLGCIDMLLIAHGTLGDQRRSELDVNDTLKEFTNNCTSVISLLTISGNYFEGRKTGCIAVISSVAGDRGRGSNYVYGAAKAGVSTFTQGLRNRLAKSGVAVVTIKPGVVATPMTAHLKKGLLTANAAKVGKGIYNAMRKGKDVVYLPGYWRFIMLIIRSIPEPVFKKLSL
jgi:short-subunit dehydrogenase